MVYVRVTQKKLQCQSCLLKQGTCQNATMFLIGVFVLDNEVYDTKRISSIMLLLHRLVSRVNSLLGLVFCGH